MKIKLNIEMPTIYLPKKERKEQSHPQRDEDEKKQLRAKLYGTKKWLKLRKTYLMEHPLCEKCLAKGKVVPAEDIHHIKSPFNYDDMSVNWNLGLDYNNLQALCKECHIEEHKSQKGYVSAEDVIRALEELFEEV